MSEAYRAVTKNTVLIRDDIGRAKRTVYDLPPEGHAYGRAEPADMEGAREVTMHWASHVPRPKPGEKVQDFKKINKMATGQNISTAKDLASFRKNNDFTLVHPGPMGPMPKVIPSDVIPSFAYGRKSRPSTPIAQVVGNQYSEEYQDVLEMTYGRYESEAATRGKQRVRLNKAAQRKIENVKGYRRSAEPEEPRELFKLTKFKKANSRFVEHTEMRVQQKLAESRMERSASGTGFNHIQQMPGGQQGKLHSASAPNLRSARMEGEFGEWGGPC